MSIVGKSQSGRACAEPASRPSAPRSGGGAKRRALTSVSTRARCWLDDAAGDHIILRSTRVQFLAVPRARQHASGSPAVCAQVSTGPKMRGARLDHAADDTPAAPQRRQGRRYGTCSAGQRPVPDVIRRAIERDGSSVLQRQPMGGLKTDQQQDGTFPRKRRPPARSNARKQHPARQASSRRSARPPPQRPGERVDPWGKVCALLAAIAPPPPSRDPGRDQAPAVTVKHGPGRSCHNSPLSDPGAVLAAKGIARGNISSD